MKADQKTKLQAEIDQLQKTNQDLVRSLEIIKGRARNIVEERVDITKESARIVLDVEHAIAKSKKV